MRALLLSALLLTAGIALVPEASAACEPNPLRNPDFCTGEIEKILDFILGGCYQLPRPLFNELCWGP